MAKTAEKKIEKQGKGFFGMDPFLKSMEQRIHLHT